MKTTILNILIPAGRTLSISNNLLSKILKVAGFVLLFIHLFSQMAGAKASELISEEIEPFSASNLNLVSYSVVEMEVAGLELSLLSPEAGSEGVALDADLTITFSEPIQAGEAFVKVLQKSNNNAILSGRPAFETDLFSIDGNSLIIHLSEQNLNAPLYETEYYVTLQEGAVEDLAGNFYSGFLDVETWSFTTEAAPTWQTLLPAHESTTVSIESDLQIVFTHSIEKGYEARDFKLIKIDGGNETVFLADINSEFISGWGTNTIVIDLPDGTLEYSSSYTVTYNSEFFSTSSGYFLPMLSFSTWSFNTEPEPDFAAPSFVSAVPETFASGVDVSANLILNFNEDIQRGSGSILIRRMNNEVIESFTSSSSDRLTFSGSQLIIDPTAALPFNTELYIQVTYSAVKDLAGNSFAGFVNWYDWTFTTEPDPSDPAPELVALSPANGATEVSRTPTFSIELSESVAGSNANDKVALYRYDTDAYEYNLGGTATFDGNIVSFSYPYTLEANTKYYILIEANTFKDAAGHYLDGLSDKDDWSFTTISGPQIVSITPPSGSTDIDFAQSIEIVFDRDVEMDDSGSMQVVDAVTMDQIGPFWYLPAFATIDGNTVTIFNPNLEFQGGQQILFNFSGGIKDPQNGLFWNGITDHLLTYEKEEQTITFDEIEDVELSEVEGNLVISASSSSGLPLTFVVESGPAVLQNTNELQLTGSGLVIVKATQAGNERFLPAEASISFSVLDATKQDQTIDFTDVPDQTYGNEPAVLQAQASSGLEVSFELVSGPGQVEGNQLHFTGAGTIVVKAVQAGDEDFNSVSSNQTIEVAKAVLMAAAEDKETTYGTTIPPLTYTISGYVHDDDIGDLDELPVVGTAATTGSDAGQYVLELIGGQDNDYTFQKTTGTLTINKAQQVITIEEVNDKLTTDSPFEITANSSSGLSLSFEVEGPASINGSMVTLSGSTGTVTVRVSQAGNINYYAAEEEISFQVTDPDKQNQTITFAAIADKTYGQTFELEATTTSGLNLSYTVVSGPAALNGSQLSLTGTGTVTIKAEQAGNDEYNPASPVSRSFAVNAASLTATAENKTKSYGAALPVLTISYSGFVNGDDEGDLTAPEISTQASAESNVGTYPITLSGGSADNYEITLVNGTLTVTKAAQSITFSAIENQLLSTGSLTLSATASSGLTVTYEVSGPVALEGAVLSFASAGEVVVTARQAGNDNFEPAADLSRSFTITDDTIVPQKQDQVITFAAIGNRTYGDAPFNVAATSSSGLSVSFSVVAGPASLDGNIVTINGAGEVTIAASQPGNDSYNAAPTVSRSFSVGKAAATVSISSLEQPADGSPKEVSVSTQPEGLNFLVTYNGEETLPVAAGNYEVVVTITDNNYQGTGTADMLLFEQVETGITSDQVRLSLNAYPNPVTDFITLEIEGETGFSNDKVIRLFDLRGNVQQEQYFSGNSYRLDLKQTASGLYLLLVQGADGAVLGNLRLKKE